MNNIKKTKRKELVMDMSEPLAYRMMPQILDEYVGQEDILGKDKILYRTINFIIKSISRA